MSLHLDLQTMFIICSSVSVASGLCMVLVQMTGQLYPGVRYWTVGMIGQGVAFTLFAYSRVMPSLVGPVVGNLFYVLYPVFFSCGLRVFAGRRAPLRLLAVAFFYVGAVTYYFSAVHPSILWRVTAIQLVIMPYFLDCAWVAWRDPAFRYRIVRPWIVGVFLLMILSGAIRIAFMFALEPERLRIWDPSAVQVVYMTFLTALSFSTAIAVMVLNFMRASRSLREKEALLLADVETRKQMEAALRESESRYRVLVEAAPEAVTVHRDGIVVYANPAAVALFKVSSAAEMVGKTLLERVHPDYRAVALLRRKHLLEDHIPVPPGELVYLKADGTPFEAEVRSSRIIFDGNACIQVSIHDISGQRRAAAERQEFERKMQETQKLESLGVLAGGIAHDFNNILTGILGNASLARMDLGPSSPAEENLKAITEGSQRAAELCRQMLAYSGKGNFVIRNLSLNRLVQETAHLLKVSISKTAELRFELAPNLPAIRADATQIRQVIMNLVINASEAIGEKEGRIDLRTGTVMATQLSLGRKSALMSQDFQDGLCVYLEVSDTGCGMSPETRAKIFEPFFTTKFAGRGLGLAAVLGIVRGHRGALEITSEQGKGTTFRLLLPCSAGLAESEGGSAGDRDGWRGKGRILVVDDEGTVRSTASSMLHRLGFEVLVATNGSEAVDMVRAAPEKMTLVLMDLMMPVMGGKQALAEIRKIRGDLPIVLMSGFNEQDAFSDPSVAESAHFLAKPFDFESLSQMLRRHLAPAS